MLDRISLRTCWRYTSWTRIGTKTGSEEKEFLYIFFSFNWHNFIKNHILVSVSTLVCLLHLCPCVWWDPAGWGWSEGCSHCHSASAWQCLPFLHSLPLRSALNWMSLHIISMHSDMSYQPTHLNIFNQLSFAIDALKRTEIRVHALKTHMQSHQQTALCVWWSFQPPLLVCLWIWSCWCAVAQTATFAREVLPNFSKLHRSANKHRPKQVQCWRHLGCKCTWTTDLEYIRPFSVLPGSTFRQSACSV